ncbi:MAG: Ig-like domain repeat protein [Actinobacteria bacterium]|nr:Ig-like domain repeat protein [Actinomycetota bacterium]
MAALLAVPGVAEAATSAGAPEVTEATGRVETVVVDPVDSRVPAAARRAPATTSTHTSAQTKTVVEVGGRLLEVPADLARTRLASTRPGDSVRVTVSTPRRGRASVVAAAPTGRRRAAATSVLGTHTLTLLPVYFTAKDSQTQTTLQNLADLTANFWTQQSGSRISMTATARDWKQVANPASCDYSAIYNAALAAHGVAAPTTLYQHVVVYFPQRSDCGWAGLGSVLGTRTWINGYPFVEVVAHELGHNFGIGHANTAVCTTGGVRVALSDTCTNTEYGDSVDVMGSGYWNNTPGNLNVALADYLGLASVTTVAAGSSASVTVAPTAQLTATRAVRVDLPSGVPVYVEYRPNAGRDFRASAWAGVQVRQRVSPYGYPASQLLDMQPATSFSNVSLPTWAVWPVPGTGLSVKVTDLTASGATVSVVPTANDATAPAKVTPTSPSAGQTVPVGSTLAWTAATDTGGAGTAAYALYVDGALRTRVGATTTSWTLPSLADGSHTVRVDATDNAGNTTAGTLVTFTVSSTTAAGPARILAPATGSWATGSVTVTWAVDKATAAAVLVDGTAAATVASGTTTATVTGLADGAHTLAVASLSGAGATTATSATVTVTTDATAPTAPSGLAVAGTKATWTASTDATSGVAGYRVSLDGGTWSTVTTTSVSLVVPDGSHSVAVRALDRAGNTSATATASFVRDASAPTGLAITAPAANALLTSRSTTLTWSAASDAQSGVTGYRVTVPGAAQPVVVDAGTLSHPLTLPEGLSTLKVAALNAAGGAAEQSVRVTVDTLAPAVPSALTVLRDGTRISWKGSTKDGGTPVSFRVVVDDGAAVTTAGTSLPLALAPGLHTFAVRAVDAAGNTSDAGTLSRWVDTTAPTAPTLTSPTDGSPSGSRTVALTWSAATDAESGIDGYVVTVNGRKQAPLGGAATGTSVTAAADGRLVVTVAAVNAAGLTGPSSSRTVLVDTAAPGTPSRLAASAAGVLTWKPAADRGSAVSYRVAVDGGTPATVTVPTFTTGESGQHTFAVTAVDAAGNTSAPATLTAWLDASAPSAPAPVAPSAGGIVATRTPVVSWAPAVDDETAVLAYRVSVNGRVVATTSGNATSAQVSVPEGAVTVTVAAVNQAGVLGETGRLALVVDTTRPRTPAGVAVSSADVLTWGTALDGGTAGTGVVGYVLYLDGVESERVAAADGTTHQVTTPGGTHVWSVAAADAAGNVSVRGTAAAVTR